MSFRARTFALVLLAALPAGGCATDRLIAIEIVPPRDAMGGPDVPAELVSWELGLTRLSSIADVCPTLPQAAAAAEVGELGHVQAFGATEAMGMPIGEVPSARWGIFVIGRDIACAPVMYGCSEVHIDGATPELITVPVVPATSAEACGCRTCNAGVCDPVALLCP